MFNVRDHRFSINIFIQQLSIVFCLWLNLNSNFSSEKYITKIAAYGMLHLLKSYSITLSLKYLILIHKNLYKGYFQFQFATFKKYFVSFFSNSMKLLCYYNREIKFPYHFNKKIWLGFKVDIKITSTSWFLSFWPTIKY